MNKLELFIENFEIIKKEHIVFNKGLTLITGESRNGKSAIFRALKYLLLNPSGSQNKIRIGTDCAKVRMLYNGNDITWVRTKKESMYIINGEEYKKVGNSNLFKLLQDTGFTYDGNKNKCYNIEGIKEILFPYGLTNSELFKLFENIFSVSDSAKIFQAYKQEEDLLSSEIKEKEIEFQRNKDKIILIEDLQKSVKKENLERVRDNLIKLNKDFSKVSISIEAVEETVNYLNIIEDTTEVEVRPYDILNEYVEVVKSLRELKEIYYYCKIIGGENKEEIISFDSLIEYGKILSALIELEEIENQFQIDLIPIEEISLKILNKYILLKNALGELKSLSNYCKIVKQQDKIDLVETISDKYIEVVKSIKLVEEIESDIESCTRNENILDKKIFDTDVKLKEYEKYRCDKCGQLLVGNSCE